MAVQKYKYEAELKAFDPSLTKCPPSVAVEKTIAAYRWANNPLSDRDFLPPGKLKPARLNRPNASAGLLALSFHSSMQDSISVMHGLMQNFDARKTLGTHVAKGRIDTIHGRCTPADKNGHFDLYEYQGVKMKSSFHVACVIPDLEPE